MKIEVCTCKLSVECIAAIDALRTQIFKIFKNHFGFADQSSAALVVPESTVAHRGTHNALCHVVITGMSATPERTPEIIGDARQEIEDLYAKTITRHPGADLPVSLYVAFQLDCALPNGSNLVEPKTTRTIT